jgi:hypothetical protein
MSRNHHFFHQVGNRNGLEFGAGVLVIKAGYRVQVRIFDNSFGLRIFARGVVQPDFQSLQLGQRGQINSAVLPPEFQRLQIALGQLRGRRLGTGLGLA